MARKTIEPVNILSHNQTVYPSPVAFAFWYDDKRIMRIEHNLTALNAQRSLWRTTGIIAKNMEKLSSGYAINRAADDAAGLAISEKMRAQVRGLAQATLNAQDGVSLVQIAEGGCNEISELLQRMNELAIKAANETLDAADRSYINTEVQQLKIETDRIAYTTDFNGIQMLITDSLDDGGGGGGTLEEGVVVGDPRIVPPFYLNGDTYSFPADFAMKIAGGDERAVAYFDYKMVPPGYSVNTNPGEDFNVIYGFFAIQMKSGYEPIDLIFTAPGGEEFRVSSSRFLSLPFPANNLSTQETQFVSGLGDVQFHWSTDYYGNYEMSIYFKPGQRNGVNDDDRTTAFDGRWFVSVDNGHNTAAVDFTFMFIGQNNTGKGHLDAGLIEYDTYTSGGGGGAGGGEARRLDDIRLLVGTSVTGGNIISVSRRDMRCRSLGLAGVDMRTTAGAYAAIDPIKQALTRVANARSYFGAVQNRLEHTIANLKNVVENTAAAESAIRDTDMAAEMVAFANHNVLMSAGQAMLAQANKYPEMVRGLLG